MGIVHSYEDESKLAFLKKCNTRHFQISYNSRYLPEKILHNLCFSFLLVITAVPREIENSAHAKFGGGGGGGGNRGHYGKCGSDV